MNLFDQIKEELCSMYDLEESQIKFDINIEKVGPALAKKIATDFARSRFAIMGSKKMTIGFGKVPGVWVNCHHKKEGEENEPILSTTHNREIF